MSQQLRYRTIQGLSDALGVEGPAASPHPPQAAGQPSWLVGGPRKLGEVSRSVCIVVAEKAIARLKAKIIRLSAELAELRGDGAVADRAIDFRVRELAECRTELSLFEEQLESLRAQAKGGE